MPGHDRHFDELEDAYHEHLWSEPSVRAFARGRRAAAARRLVSMDLADAPSEVRP